MCAQLAKGKPPTLHRTQVTVLQVNGLTICRLEAPCNSDSIFFYQSSNVCCSSTGKASVFPQPLDTEEFIRAQMYDVRYSPAVPPVYSWPSKDLRVDMIQTHTTTKDQNGQRIDVENGLSDSCITQTTLGREKATENYSDTIILSPSHSYACI